MVWVMVLVWVQWCFMMAVTMMGIKMMIRDLKMAEIISFFSEGN